jgi:hypothetical protein
MKIWAIADLHLGQGVGKTMDRFGAEWRGHAERIRENCQKCVAPDDILLLPGDLSWATKRTEAVLDLEYMAALPGIKVCIKGNHDYWWESDKPIAHPGLLSPPQVFDEGRVGIAGTRGWQAPVAGSDSEAVDRKHFERERTRLQRSLDAIAGCALKIAMIHYPPQTYLDLLKAAGVAVVVYGHVHLRSFPEDEALVVQNEVVEGVRLWCVACDRVDFEPQCIMEVA